MRYVFYDDFKPGLVKDDAVVDISDELEVKPYQTPQMVVEKFIKEYEKLKPKLEKALKEKKGYTPQRCAPQAALAETRALPMRDRGIRRGGGEKAAAELLPQGLDINNRTRRHGGPAQDKGQDI
ncbi:MAG: hypothetical protein ACEROO_01260 [Candidatus Bathyarchaeota archaeon]